MLLVAAVRGKIPGLRWKNTPRCVRRRRLSNPFNRDLVPRLKIISSSWSAMSGLIAGYHGAQAVFSAALV